MAMNPHKFNRQSSTKAFLLLLLTGIATQAAAEPSSADNATAQALFAQGKKLMEAHNLAEACPKFEESARVAPHGGTLLNLGDCYEQQGRIAAAWTTFLEAAAAANRSNNPAREKEARNRADKLAPQVPKMVIAPVGADKVPGFALTRDRVTVGPAQWGAAIPVELGTHVVSANAPDHKPWEKTVEVTKKGETVTVEVPALEALVTTPPPAPPPIVAPSSNANLIANAPPVQSERPPGMSPKTQKTLALVVGGVGVAGVAVGSVFGLMSKSKHDAADQHCSGANCNDQTGVDLRSEARSRGNVSTVAFIVGAAGLAGGVTLWFTTPRDTTMPTAQLTVAPGSLFVKGTF